MWLYGMLESVNVPSAYHTAEHDLGGQPVAFFCRSVYPNHGLALLKNYSDRTNIPPVDSAPNGVIGYRLVAMSEIPDDTDTTLLEALGAREISAAIIDRWLSSSHRVLRGCI